MTSAKVIPTDELIARLLRLREENPLAYRVIRDVLMAFAVTFDAAPSRMRTRVGLQAARTARRTLLRRCRKLGIDWPGLPALEEVRRG